MKVLLITDLLPFATTHAQKMLAFSSIHPKKFGNQHRHLLVEMEV